MVELIDRIELRNDGVRVTLKIPVPAGTRECRPAAFLVCPASCHSK